MRADPRLTRRSMLAAGAMLVAGCSTATSRRRRSAPNPDAAALAVAVRDERRLVAAYDAAIAHSSGHVLAGLRVDRAAHAVHLTALQRALGAPVTTAGKSVGNLQVTLAISARSLSAAAATAHAGNAAALLASVAASHRVMSE